ncbi:GPP34 family phosphoprotein [Actinokineospora guangxiensis]|uniref:GPP34 family phosphoprotein n=1 Tax=Actinokineospora guangxiensis TaxID=1490288 RepID=A0ABW0EW42_9PSEU
MLVAHDLLLLLIDDESGKVSFGMSEPDKALAGAVLVDLAERDLVGVADGRLAAKPGPTPPEPVLAQALAVVRERDGQKPKNVLGPLAKGLRDHLADDLVEAGILRRDEKKVLGLFPTTRLPTADASRETTLRAHLAAVLAGTAEPDGRTGALIALLHAMDVVTRVIPADDKKAAKRRAKQIAVGDWAAAAVRKAVQEVQSAVMVAVIASTGATTAGTT